MPQPLCEVFGFPVNNMSDEAIRHRREKLCPFNNKIPHCTKDKKKDPLGVCSVFDTGRPIITCPIRFRENWRILSDVYGFTLPGASDRDFVSEAKLVDDEKESVGKIDIVLLAIESGVITDFGALEIQAVYISGNVRDPFLAYMDDPISRCCTDWKGPNYPGPDWLSSVKRLEHQMIMKGSLFKIWNKKFAVAVQTDFYSTLRGMARLETKEKEDADMAWFLYDLSLNPAENRYNLTLERTVYFRLAEAIEQFSKISAGDVGEFEAVLKKKYEAVLKTRRPKRTRGV